MTTTTTQQPKALQLADRLKERIRQLNNSWNAKWNRSTEEFDLCAKSEGELRFQHAEIARLTYENEALKAKNQPLLIHVIADIADGLTLWRDGGYVIDDYLAFARAIELAHGIGEKP